MKLNLNVKPSNKSLNNNDPFSENDNDKGIITVNTKNKPIEKPIINKENIPSNPIAKKSGLPKTLPSKPINSNSPKADNSLKNTESKPKLNKPSFMNNDKKKPLPGVKKEIKEEVKEENNVVEDIKQQDIEQDKKNKISSKSKKKAKKDTSSIETPTNTNTSNSSEEKVDAKEAEVINSIFKMPLTTMKYDEAITTLINPNMISEEWETYKEELKAEDDNIEIQADMQENSVKKTSEALNILRRKVWLELLEHKAIMESISNRDTEGIIERIKYTNSDGSNEILRKKAGIMAAMSHTTEDGEIINYYEIYDETRRRFYFLDGLMKSIQYKTNLLITITGAVKMEKNQIINS